MRKKANWSALVASLLVATTMAVATGSGSQVCAAPDAFTQAKQKYTAKNYQGALNEFKALSAKYPTRADFHYYLALCNQCLSRTAEAKNEYKWVMDNDRGDLNRMATAGYEQLSGGRANSTAQAGSVKVVMDFYTTWCRPCKEMEPTFEAAKNKFRSVNFQRIDAEKPANKALAAQYKIQGYPTIVMLDGKGNVLFNQPGQLMGDDFFQLIEKAGGR